jgi:hypothetical protein
MADPNLTDLLRRLDLALSELAVELAEIRTELAGVAIVNRNLPRGKMPLESQQHCEQSAGDPHQSAGGASDGRSLGRSSAIPDLKPCPIAAGGKVERADLTLAEPALLLSAKCYRRSTSTDSRSR